LADVVDKALHAAGFRFRLHVKKLPGKPDLVLEKYKTVVFVHGCFWHGHECEKFRWPKTRREFWKEKIEGNCSRDLKALAELHAIGWHSALVWECNIIEQTQLLVSTLLKRRRQLSNDSSPVP
jgi:DNA mismatch endonuclease, patch repair protein